MEIRIAFLYPDLLCLYGDRGNISALKYRCERRHINVIIDEISINDYFDENAYDILFIGGGQDFEQGVLLDDLSKGKDVKIKKCVENNTVVLAICGGFQMLGNYYETYDKKRLDFIGALDFYTIGEKNRLVGNYMFKTEYGNIVGFENHSGRTYLDNCEPFGEVISGFGNNGKDNTEGARFKNTFCTYSHGPILPKNASFCDALIEIAMKRKCNNFTLTPLDSTFEDNAKFQTINLYFK